MQTQNQKWLIVFIVIVLSSFIGRLLGSNPSRFTIFLLGSAGLAIAVVIFSAPTPEKVRLRLLMTTVFVLFFHPTARIVLSGIPIYLVDILIFLVFVSFVFTRRPSSFQFRDAGSLVLLLSVFWIPSTLFSYLHEILLTEIYLEVTFMFFRTLLSIGIAFLIPMSIITEEDVRIFLWAMVFGGFLSAILAVVNSFLPPGDPVLAFIDNLTPSDLAEYQLRYIDTIGNVRARALAGGPNHLGFLLNIAFAASLGLVISNRQKKNRILLSAIVAVIMLGVVVTFTRSAYVGAILIVFWFVLRSGANRGRIVLTGIAATIMIGVVMGQDWVNFDFILERFASIPDWEQDYGNSVRVLAYADAPAYLNEHPQWIFVGRGFAMFDLWLRGLLSEEIIQSSIANTENHSTFIMTMYQRGLISMFVLIGIWAIAFSTAYRSQGRAKANSIRHLYVTIGAALLGILPGMLFDHFPASSIRTQTAMFMVFGCAVLLRVPDSLLKESH